MTLPEPTSIETAKTQGYTAMTTAYLPQERRMLEKAIEQLGPTVSWCLVVAKGDRGVELWRQGYIDTTNDPAQATDTLKPDPEGLARLLSPAQTASV